mmetsp:Transcript_12048/g.33357  ORF Transcript_12048/g.33357 Transcript_12048/m.33357 type:complete len:224 (-) Transcript_12048:501-1172(-)
MRWVSDKVVQILQRPLPGDEGLGRVPKHRQHGKPPVFDLLDLLFQELGGLFRQTERVEELSAGVIDATGEKDSHRLQRFDAHPSGVLRTPHENELAQSNREDALVPSDPKSLQARVVYVHPIVEHGVSHPPPHWLGDGIESEVPREGLGDQAAHRPKHGPPSVEQLGLEEFSESRARVRPVSPFTVPWTPPIFPAESQRIETRVAWQGSRQVVRSRLQEQGSA